MISQGDCRLGLQLIEQGSIELVLTDPPYGLDGMGAQWNLDAMRRKMRSGVVGGLPAGMRFHKDQGRQLRRWLTPIAREWHRVLKPGGFVLCFAQPRLSHSVATSLEDVGFEIRDMLAWYHGGGQPKAFSQDHFVRKMQLPAQQQREIILDLQGRKTPQLKPEIELIVLAQRPRQGTFVQNWITHRTGLIDVKSPFIEPDTFPGQLIEHPKAQRVFDHVTVKPVGVLRHLIRIFSARGDLVLDPFAGTGSTGVACALEGREFIGFELDATIARAAQDRVAQAYRKTSQKLC